MNQTTQLERLPVSGRVDLDNHIILGVSLMRIGPAKGHDMEVDRKTLEQAKNLMPADGLKAKVGHRSPDGVMSLNGRFKNPRIDGSNLRADWYLNPDMPSTKAIEAIALGQPEDCGISLTCHTTKERANGKNYMRLEGLKSADLVDDPAANESLLSESFARRGLSGSGAGKTELQTKMQRALTELDAAFGRDKVDLAIRFKREFGDDWKTELTELQGHTEVAGDHIEGETELVVEPLLLTFLEEADAQNISLAEVERRRRARVIEAANAPDASVGLKLAGAIELSRLSVPALEVTWLDARTYENATGVPWSFTTQDFSDEDAAIARSNAIVVGRQDGATELGAGSHEIAASGNIIQQIQQTAQARELDVLRDAQAQLDAASGRAKVDLAMKFTRNLGVSWKNRLQTLERAASQAA